MTEQGTPEWHSARAGRVTASVVGGILGLSPYQTRESVMRAMVRASLGAETEFQGNVATMHGNFHEEGARIEFEMVSGFKVNKCGFFEYEDWLGASPDGLIGDYGIWECKSPFSLRKDKDPKFKTLEEQPHYAAQIQIQLFCTGRERCHFTQWTPAKSVTEIVLRDNAWLNATLPVLRQFHAEYLEELKNNADAYLSDLRKEVDTPQAHQMVQEWDEIKEQMELLEERKKDLLADMVKLVGGKDSIIAGRKLTLVQKEGAVSYAKALKAIAPDADLEPYRGKPSEFWKLS